MVHLEEIVNSMTPEDIRATITEICRVQPSYILHILHILDHCNEKVHPRANHLGFPVLIVETPTEQERMRCNRTLQNCNSRLPFIFSILITVCLISWS
ncbi:uncharacterized protein LOC144622385 isoform X2 [Crassostrea virginica]